MKRFNTYNIATRGSIFIACMSLLASCGPFINGEKATGRDRNAGVANIGDKKFAENRELKEAVSGNMLFRVIKDWDTKTVEYHVGAVFFKEPQKLFVLEDPKGTDGFAKMDFVSPDSIKHIEAMFMRPSYKPDSLGDLDTHHVRLDSTTTKGGEDKNHVIKTIPYFKKTSKDPDIMEAFGGATYTSSCSLANMDKQSALAKFSKLSADSVPIAPFPPELFTDSFADNPLTKKLPINKAKPWIFKWMNAAQVQQKYQESVITQLDLDDDELLEMALASNNPANFMNGMFAGAELANLDEEIDLDLMEDALTAHEDDEEAEEDDESDEDADASNQKKLKSDGSKTGKKPTTSRGAFTLNFQQDATITLRVRIQTFTTAANKEQIPMVSVQGFFDYTKGVATVQPGEWANTVSKDGSPVPDGEGVIAFIASSMYKIGNMAVKTSVMEKGTVSLITVKDKPKAGTASAETAQPSP